jgi:hypothetical protein
MDLKEYLAMMANSFLYGIYLPIRSIRITISSLEDLTSSFFLGLALRCLVLHHFLQTPNVARQRLVLFSRSFLNSGLFLRQLLLLLC